MREEEKGENAQTVEDAKAGQAAVSEAIAVLKEFYAKAAEATALAQKGAERQAPPKTWDSSKPFKGQQVEGGNVIGFLEVIHSDFARLESETVAAESQAAAAYQDFRTESGVNRTEKQKELDNKKEKKRNQEADITEKQGSSRRCRTSLTWPRRTSRSSSLLARAKA